MNFVKRAGITLWARKGRSVLLVLTSTVILAFVMAGLIVQNAALKAATNAANSVGSTVTLSANREKMFEQMKAAGRRTDMDWSRYIFRHNDVDYDANGNDFRS